MQRLLLVDDDATTRALLHAALALDGYEVSDAGGGDEALRLLDRERPDVVLTDLIMPGTDGLSLCKAIRAKAELEDVVIIALTGGDYPERLSGLCDVFLRKPVDIARLIDTLEQLEASKLLNTAPVLHALRW
jgi:CheY-like chemotaxis protein